MRVIWALTGALGFLCGFAGGLAIAYEQPIRAFLLILIAAVLTSISIKNILESLD